MTFLGNEEIKEVRATDRVTPGGAEVREVVFLSELDLLRRHIEDEESRLTDLREEQKLEVITDERKKEIDKSIELGIEEIKRLEESETPEMAKERIVFASYQSIEYCETEEPDTEYYHKRKVKVVGEILKVMAEWNLQAVEIGPIVEGIGQSYNKNMADAISEKFGKKQSDLNMLDLHYAITENRKDN